MKSKTTCLLTGVFIMLTNASPSHAQAIGHRSEGPIIEGFGGVYDVPGLDYVTPTGGDYRVVFDVAIGADQPHQLNARINTLARFLNMHGRAGVALERMQLALVLHGTAGKDALENAEYYERYGVNNPNQPLLQALSHAGVRIFLCGQTAMHRNLPKEKLDDSVQLALSAMTVLVTLQAEGYSLISF